MNSKKADRKNDYAHILLSALLAKAMLLIWARCCVIYARKRTRQNTVIVRSPSFNAPPSRRSFLSLSQAVN